jgi:hypothetical protein
MLKRLMWGAALAAALGMAALAWTFAPGDLVVPEPGQLTPPPTMTADGVSVRAVLAGKILTRAGMTYRGGNLLEERATGMSALLVEPER